MTLKPEELSGHDEVTAKTRRSHHGTRRETCVAIKPQLHRDNKSQRLCSGFTAAQQCHRNLSLCAIDKPTCHQSGDAWHVQKLILIRLDKTDASILLCESNLCFNYCTVDSYHSGIFRWLRYRNWTCDMFLVLIDLLYSYSCQRSDETFNST